MFRFTIRDLLWLTVVVALMLGWWLHYWTSQRLQAERNRQATELRQKLKAAGDTIKRQQLAGKDAWTVIKRSWQHNESESANRQ